MASQGRFPAAAVVTGCLLGCVLPAIAYAEAMSALFGFGAVARKWVWLLIGVPTFVWLGAAFRVHIAGQSLSRNLWIIGIALAAQLALAAAVAAAIAAVRRRSL